MSKYLIIFLLVLGVVLGAGFQQHQISQLRADHLGVLRDLAVKTADAKQALLVYEREVHKTISTIRNETNEEVAQLQTKLETSESARGILLKRLRTANTQSTKSAGTDSAVGQLKQSVENQATFDLFAELLDRHTRELQEVGSYAEQLKIAGLACEKSYDAVSIPTHSSAK